MTTLQKMRIIAVPLTRPRRAIPGPSLLSASSNTSGPSSARPNRLTYYQFQITTKKKKSTATTKDGTGEGYAQGKKGWLPEEGIVDYAIQKAADIWAGFGKAPGGWRLKTFQFGEKLVDRMEFEELALKSIDPSLGPSIKHLKQSPLAEKHSTPLTIQLIFPPSILSSSTALSDLKAYTTHRIPRHKRGFYLWMVLAPLTAPFMIIPVIPNLPFFFCVWRSWSHYRAYRSSKYLQSLIEHDVIVPEANDALDEVYRLRSIEGPTTSPPLDPPSSTSKPRPDSNPPPTSEPHPSSQNTPGPGSKHDILLTRDLVPSILSIFDLKPDGTAAADLYRAVEQARVRVTSGRDEL